jgi:hypothetical protein
MMVFGISLVKVLSETLFTLVYYRAICPYCVVSAIICLFY